jgi:membrane-associated protease RseP (regulator of RpoE activity)
MNDMAKSVTASVAIHLGIFALQFAMFSKIYTSNTSDQQTVQAEEGNRSSSGNDMPDAKIILPPARVELIQEKDLPKPKVTVEAPKRKKIQPIDDRCELFYGGIGVRTELGLVTSVFPEYPAAIAGIKVGDRIVSPNPTQVRGEPNEPIVVKVLRGQEILEFEIIRAKICYEAPKE